MSEKEVRKLEKNEHILLELKNWLQNGIKYFSNLKGHSESVFTMHNTLEKIEELEKSI
jgi:hypothetical protein